MNLSVVVVDTQRDVREPVMRTRDQGYMSNMIRAGTVTANYERGTTEEAARLEDDKIDHKCRAEGNPFSPEYGNIIKPVEQ